MPEHPPDSVDKRSPFSAAVLSVLFALTFEKALERSLGGIAAYNDTFAVHDRFVAEASHYLLLLLQLTAFLLTLFRFYAGAYRLHVEAPPSTDRWSVLWNLTNTTLLFVGFYVAALLVPTRGLFALFVAVFHLVDLGWFGLGRPLLKGHTALERASQHFIVFDVVTIVLFAVMGVWWWVDRFDTRWIQLSTSLILIGMFFVDVIWKCRHFYFAPEKWRKESGSNVRVNDSSRSSKEECMTHPKPKLYFAGPLFTQGERLWNEQVAAAIAEAGYEVLLPQKQAEAIVGTAGLTPEVVEALFQKAVESIEEADVVVAILDGPDADSGTSFECGYAFARKKPILGVRTDLRLGGDDPKQSVNLMLSKGCTKLLRIGLDSLGQPPDFVAHKVIAGVRELLGASAAHPGT